MSQKGFAPILIVLFLALAALGGYFVYTKNYQAPKPVPDQVACTQEAKLCPDGSSVGRSGPKCEFTPCPSPKESLSNTPNWITKTNLACNVSFMVPPKQEPYYYPYDPNRSPSVTEDKGSGRLWIYEESGNNSSVTFKTPTEASGFVAGTVSVYCEDIPLNQSVESWVESIDGTIKEKLNLWGKEIFRMKYKNSISETDYYIFKAKDKIYSIEKRSMSDTEFVRNTTEQIFNELQFKD